MCVTSAVDGHQWVKVKRKKQTEVTKLNICTKCNSVSNGAVGCWLSHLATWRLGIKYNIPIIALESDTSAIANWDISPSVYKDYDILFLHNHQSIQRKCSRTKVNEVREGFPYWYATGAMLYTNNNPSRVKRVWEDELINGTASMPIGHWFNRVYQEKKLRVGSLCPNFFYQRQDHVSTISGEKAATWSTTSDGAR